MSIDELAHQIAGDFLADGFITPAMGSYVAELVRKRLAEASQRSETGTRDLYPPDTDDLALWTARFLEAFQLNRAYYGQVVALWVRMLYVRGESHGFNMRIPERRFVLERPAPPVDSRLRETLEQIADFAVGHGDVCEIIAQRARAALGQTNAAPGEEGPQ
jgi:hypothetical protein